MMSEFYVYVLFRLDTGAPCYVGKGKGGRIERHARMGNNHRNPHLANIINKYGVAEIKIRENLTELEAFETEIAFIAAIGRRVKGGSLVNLTDGGEGPSGLIFPKSSLAKLSAASKEFWKSEEARQIVSERSTKFWAVAGNKEKVAAKVRKFWGTEEAKRAQSEKAKARWKDPVYKAETSRKISLGRKGVMLGIPLSEETKAKMSAVRKGRPGCPGTIAAVQGSIWINDGAKNKRLKTGSEIPDGWRVGQLRKAQQEKENDRKAYGGGAA